MIARLLTAYAVYCVARNEWRWRRLLWRFRRAAKYLQAHPPDANAFRWTPYPDEGGS